MKHRELLLQENFDCHVHTPESVCCEDITIEKLQEKAARLGISYAVTDHSAHLYFPRELAWCMGRADFPEIFASHRAAGRQAILAHIDRLRENNIPVGIELDIYPDGNLVFEEDLFPEFDLVVGAIHALATLREKKKGNEVVEEFKWLTKRLFDYGEIDVFGHPFRMLLRADIPVSDALIRWTVDLAREHDVALEINSHYKFPETDQKMAALAQREGVLLVNGSDAHFLREFGDYSYHREIRESLAGQASGGGK